MRACVGKERGGLRLRMGETGNPFVQREEATQREGLKGEGVGELRRGAGAGVRPEWKELTVPVLCSPSHCRSRGP